MFVFCFSSICKVADGQNLQAIFPDTDELNHVEKSKHFRETTVAMYEDEEFSHHFRMSRYTFDQLFGILHFGMPRPYPGFGKKR